MKVRTNLTPGELDAVGKGLQALSKSSSSEEIVPENPAERELMRRADFLWEQMLNNLQDEFSALLLQGDSDE